jgi:hypothetical protein
MSDEKLHVFKNIVPSSRRRALAIAVMVVSLALTFTSVWLAGGVANAQQSNMTSMGPANVTATQAKNTVSRDSVLITGPRTIGAGDFIHVYDASPYHIMSGHIAMKVPCDNGNKTTLQVFVGKTPDLKPMNLTLIKEMSKPGQQCLYHADVKSVHGPNGLLISDIVVKNTGSQDVKLTDTSTILVGVDEVMPTPS